MYQSEWANTVLKMLKNKPHNITYEEIASRSGLTIGFIETFASGSVKAPTITRVELLYKTLKDIKAEHVKQVQSWGNEINVTE